MERNQRLALLAAAIVVAVVAFVLLSPSDDDGGKSATTAAQTTTTAEPATTVTETQTTTAPAPAPEPAVRTITIENAKPKGGVQKLEFKKGDEIRFKVVSDTADEIHVHGYDLMKDVEAGGSVTFNFPATIDGGFEVELEGHGEQIAELSVAP